MFLKSKTVQMACALLLLAQLQPVFAGDDPPWDPLFQSDELLEIHITAPISTLTEDRADEEYLPARIAWVEPDGRKMELDIGLRARGNYRRQRDTCLFPPIRINFKKSEVKNTIFHKQDALKIITHCKDDSERYEQGVVREYLVYKMMNLFTDLSYRVRLLKVRYTDTDSDREDRVNLAVVIEHKDRLAKRSNLEPYEVHRSKLDTLDAEYTALMTVFQYMIGNTDYSPVAGAPGENCCHNVNLFISESGTVFPVPYDFDITGLVNTPYATPNPRFNLRTVRQRLYRGHCVHNVHLPAVIQAFKDRRDALFAMVENEPQLTAGSKKAMSNFLTSFYKIIDKPSNVDKRIIQKCRG